MIHFSENMSSLGGKKLVVEKSVLLRIGFVQTNMDTLLFEYVWFVLRSRGSVCLSSAIEPIVSRLQVPIDKYCVIQVRGRCRRSFILSFYWLYLANISLIVFLPCDLQVLLHIFHYWIFYNEFPSSPKNPKCNGIRQYTSSSYMTLWVPIISYTLLWGWLILDSISNTEEG